MHHNAEPLTPHIRTQDTRKKFDMRFSGARVSLVSRIRGCYKGLDDTFAPDGILDSGQRLSTAGSGILK